MRVKVINRKKTSALVMKEQTIEKISEDEFIRIIDNIHHLVHKRIVQNAKIKMFPDLKISEYRDKFNI